MEGLRTLETGERRRVGSAESPPLLIGAYLEHSPVAGWKNRLQLDYRASRDPFNGSTAWPEGAVDSLFLAHASASVALGPGKLNVGVRNLFDRKHYSVVAQAYNGGYLWIPEQGRRLSLSYSADW
jgi:iron complex outermembrane receptor protein